MATLMVEGAFLSAFLQVLFDRLASRPFLDYFRRRKFPVALLQKLKVKLLAFNLVLSDAEEKQITNTSVRTWLDELKDVTYLAEDLLDEIAAEVLLEAETDSNSACLLNEKMEQRIREMLDQLDHLSELMANLGLNQIGVGGSSSQKLPTTSLVDEKFVYGRDMDKEVIKKFLLSGNQVEEGHEIGVGTIVGMGGLGKTTMAQLVYNDNDVVESFALRVWVCVSESFDVTRITKTILQAVTGSACDTGNDLDLLQIRLKEMLNGKKFLLILDDVWTENYHDWLSLKNPLRFGANGSKIIVTTRIGNVASVVGRGLTHHLKVLSDEDAWFLFAKHAFANNHSKNLNELVQIGKKIVSKCMGLPLTLETIGRLLRSKSNVDEWYDILYNELWELPNDNSIAPALMLSYHYLPSRVKPCFAYSAVFPKNFEFKKEDIVLWWMAEGFLYSSNGKKQMEEVGNDFFDTLVSTSFFQKAISSKKKSRYKMHDLVNDLAKVVSGVFCFRVEGDKLCELSEKTRYLSYSPNAVIAPSKFQVIKCAKVVRSFLSMSTLRYCITEHILWDILRSFRCLRVLNLPKSRRITELPDFIGGLKHLRYLNISGTNIQNLPDSITSLCYLQTLLMNQCWNLSELPANIGRLITLRYLEFVGAEVKEMPLHMSKLVNLQSLSGFIVGKKKGSTIKELKHLNDVHGVLKISNLENVASARDAQEGNMKDKVHIKRLLLVWNDDIEDSQIARDVLDNLQPHTKLELLSIKGFQGTRFPDWLGDDSFSNMTHLQLDGCNYCFSLPPVGQLPSLQFLSIKGFHKIVRVGPEFYGKSSSNNKTFMSLEALKFDDMPQLEEWVCLTDFPCLKDLEILSCPKLKGPLPDHLPCLKKIKLRGCDMSVLLSGSADANLHSIQSLISQSLPTIKELAIFSCITHEAFPMSDLPITLEDLQIVQCPDLELRLPEHDDDIQIGSYSTSSLWSLFLLDSCDTMKSFPICLFPNFKLHLGNCINLESLWTPKGFEEKNLMSFLSISGCGNLKSLPERMHDLLPSLESLSISGCGELESFPEGGLPSNLKKLGISFCPKLMTRRMEWGLQRLSNLKCLTICGGAEGEMESFPEEGLLPSSLTYLAIECFPNLKYLNQGGLQHLTSLKTLRINKCEKLLCLPEESLLNSLSELNICMSPLLQQWCQREEGKGWAKIAHIEHL